MSWQENKIPERIDVTPMNQQKDSTIVLNVECWGEGEESYNQDIQVRTKRQTGGLHQ